MAENIIACISSTPEKNTEHIREKTSGNLHEFLIIF